LGNLLSHESVGIIWACIGAGLAAGASGAGAGQVGDLIAGGAGL